MAYYRLDTGPPFINNITLQNITTLINFNQKIKQNFSFPFFVIEYISKYCNITESQKLMKACKYLRILQIRIGFCHLLNLNYRLFFDRGSQHTQLTLYLDIFKNKSYYTFFENAENFTIEFRKIKVWQRLHLRVHRHQKFQEIFKITDLSDLRELHMLEYSKPLSDDMLAHILQPSLQVISCNTFRERCQFSFLKLAFEILPIVSSFCSEQPFGGVTLSSKQFKAMLSVNRQNKFKEFRIGYLNFDLNADDILKFCDSFIENQGCLILEFHSSKDISDLMVNLENSKKLRQENGIALCRIILL